LIWNPPGGVAVADTRAFCRRTQRWPGVCPAPNHSRRNA